MIKFGGCQIMKESFSHQYPEKTVEIRDPRVMVIFKSVNEEFCPVRELSDYAKFCIQNNIVLRDGHFFARYRPPRLHSQMHLFPHLQLF